MTFFETQRLLGKSLSLDDYLQLEQGIEPTWMAEINSYRHLITNPGPLPYRIPRVKSNPEFAKIGLVLAIEKSTGQIIGSAGFHDFPKDLGMIEIGFEIVAERQNQGFGAELLHGMWRAICQRQDVKVLRYTVSPQNAPSLYIIQKLNFELIGEQIDPEDGIELIYEMSKSEYISKTQPQELPITPKP